MDLARHKSRIHRKNGDSLLQGEEVLAAFILLPLGEMRRKLFTSAIGQIAGGVTGAAFGPGAGIGADQGLESGLEGGFQAVEGRRKVQSYATASKFPGGRILFVITDRRFLVFGCKPGSWRVRYTVISAFPLSAIIDMQMTLGLAANKIRLTFADGASVLRDLPFGQGKHRNLIRAFTRAQVNASPAQAPPARQVIRERGNQTTSPSVLLSAVKIVHSAPPLPSRVSSIVYPISRGLLFLSIGAIMVILLLLIHLLFGVDLSEGGSSVTPAWVSSANDYCRTVVDPALKQSGILTAATPAEYARAVPAAAAIYHRMDQHLLSIPVSGQAQLAVPVMSADGDQVAKYEQAAAKAYDAGNSIGFKVAVHAANSWATDFKRIANVYGLDDCAQAG
jgi:hypothetical protein